MSKVIYVGYIPNNWTLDNVKSVIRNTGTVKDIRLAFEPGLSRNKGFCFIEYATPEEAQRAIRLLSMVRVAPNRRLRAEFSKEVIRGPPGVEKSVMELLGDFLPPGVELPEELENGPIEKVPERFLKASERLPELIDGVLLKDTKLSQTLAAFPPPQLVAIIALLRNFAADGDSASAKKVLQFSPELAAAVAQALFSMGFVDEKVVKSALETEKSTLPVPPATSVPRKRPFQGEQRYRGRFEGHNTYNQNQSYPGQQSYPQNYNNNYNIPFNQGPPSGMDVPPFPPATMAKLAQLEPQKAEVIVKLLKLSPQEVQNLSAEQRGAVENIRAQYL